MLAPLRDWLRTQGTLAGSRVWAHGLPADAALPSVVVTKVGLVTDNTVTEQTMVQVDCWAAKGDARIAEQLAAEVKNALLQAVPSTQLGSSTVRLMGASIEGEVALHDADDGTARYSVTAIVTTKVVA
jgi:hypothetical protein